VYFILLDSSWSCYLATLVSSGFGPASLPSRAPSYFMARIFARHSLTSYYPNRFYHSFGTYDATAHTAGFVNSGFQVLRTLLSPFATGALACRCQSMLRGPGSVSPPRRSRTFL